MNSGTLKTNSGASAKSVPDFLRIAPWPTITSVTSEPSISQNWYNSGENVTTQIASMASEHQSGNAVLSGVISSLPVSEGNRLQLTSQAATTIPCIISLSATSAVAPSNNHSVLSQSVTETVTSGQTGLKTFAPEDYLNPIPRKEPPSNVMLINQPMQLEKPDAPTDSSKLSQRLVDKALSLTTQTGGQVYHVAANDSHKSISKRTGRQKTTYNAMINTGMEKNFKTEEISCVQNFTPRKERNPPVQDQILPIVIKPLQSEAAVRKGSRKRNAPRKIEVALFKPQATKRSKTDIAPLPSPQPPPRQARYPRDCKAPNKTERKSKTDKKPSKSVKQSKIEKPNSFVGNEKHKRRKCKKNIIHIVVDNSENEEAKETTETIKPISEVEEPLSKPLEFCNTCLVMTNHGGDEECPFNAPKNVVPNDGQNRILYGLPSCLTLGRSRLKPMKYSIYARDEIVPYTQFGPLKGDVYKPEDLDLNDVDVAHLWTAEFKNTIFPRTFLYTKETAASNYLKFLQPHTPGSKMTYNIQQNLTPDGIYFISTKTIQPGEELVMRCLEFPHRVYRGIESRSDLSLIDWKTSCAQCDLDFGTLLYKIRHRLLVHNANPGMYAFGPCYMCWRCEEEFKQVKDYMAHVKAQHSDQDLYCCIICQSTFKQRDEYESHMRSHRGHPNTCDKCEEAFPSLAAMRAHTWRQHSRGVNLECRHCAKWFASEPQLQAHTRRVHSQTAAGKTELCDQCGKVFTDAHNHRQHYLTHTGLKPFTCPMPRCAHATTTKQCMQHHLRKIHMLTDELHPEIVANFYFTIDNQKSKYREMHGKEVGDLVGNRGTVTVKGSCDEVTNSEEIPSDVNWENDVTVRTDDVSEDDEEIAN